MGQLVDYANATLEQISPTPRLDAEILVCHASGLSRSQLIAQSNHSLDGLGCKQFDLLLQRRRKGEPIAYITGHKEFWSLDLEVTPDTLIPRPETEHLVEQALIHIPPDRPIQARPFSVADLGTGSGAVALALARERPQSQIVATDISEKAIAVARQNAHNLGINNIEFHQGDWFAPLADTQFDLIVSNPPYVRQTDPHLGEGDVRFEPKAALTSGAEGLDAICKLVTQAPNFLAERGWLVLEHGYDQAEAVMELLKGAGFNHCATYRDLNDQPRVSEAQIV
ncbi:MAG: peptide chain release factor N(5)-glutamine methyltransferase [Gammaproteobacteria bacterium]|nr:peptide chain release factor N(5)-glutamine methyltransferase [Gammaproteobacteria bacterium]